MSEKLYQANINLLDDALRNVENAGDSAEALDKVREAARETLLSAVEQVKGGMEEVCDALSGAAGELLRETGALDPLVAAALARIEGLGTESSADLSDSLEKIRRSIGYSSRGYVGWRMRQIYARGVNELREGADSEIYTSLQFTNEGVRRSNSEIVALILADPENASSPEGVRLSELLVGELGRVAEEYPNNRYITETVGNIRSRLGLVDIEGLGTARGDDGSVGTIAPPLVPQANVYYSEPPGDGGDGRTAAASDVFVAQRAATSAGTGTGGANGDTEASPPDVAPRLEAAVTTLAPETGNAEGVNRGQLRAYLEGFEGAGLAERIAKNLIEVADGERSEITEAKIRLAASLVSSFMKLEFSERGGSQITAADAKVFMEYARGLVISNSEQLRSEALKIAEETNDTARELKLKFLILTAFVKGNYSIDVNGPSANRFLQAVEHGAANFVFSSHSSLLHRYRISEPLSTDGRAAAVWLVPYVSKVLMYIRNVSENIDRLNRGDSSIVREELDKKTTPRLEYYALVNPTLLPSVRNLQRGRVTDTSRYLDATKRALNYDIYERSPYDRDIALRQGLYDIDCDRALSVLPTARVERKVFDEISGCIEEAVSAERRETTAPLIAKLNEDVDVVDTELEKLRPLRTALAAIKSDFPARERVRKALLDAVTAEKEAKNATLPEGVTAEQYGERLQTAMRSIEAGLQKVKRTVIGRFSTADLRNALERHAGTRLDDDTPLQDRAQAILADLRTAWQQLEARKTVERIGAMRVINGSEATIGDILSQPSFRDGVRVADNTMGADWQEQLRLPTFAKYCEEFDARSGATDLENQKRTIENRQRLLREI